MATRFPSTVPDVVDRSRTLAHQLLPRLAVRAAFLGGAPTAGLGTPTSDVDVHVVRDDDPGRPADQFVVDGTRVDVRYWTAASLRERVERCTAYRFTETEPGQLDAVSRTTLDPVVRLALGEILLDDGTLAGLRKMIADAEPQFVTLIIGVLAVEADNLVEDAKGFVQNSAEGPACHVSRLALLSAAEAYLASRGDIYLGQKWVWDRWRRTVAGALGDRAQGLVLGTVGGHPIEDTLARLWLAQDLFVLAMSGAGYPVITRPAPGLVCRTPFAVPVPTTTAVLVNRTGHKSVRLSRQGALLWGIAHGRRRDEAVAMCREVLAGTVGDVAVDEIASYHESLCRAGLLVPHQDRR